VRLTTSSQVGNKVFGCVVCRFRIAASKQSLDEAPYINCPKLSQTSKHHLQSYCLLFSWSINLGFLTEGKSAAIFITPSSWGSQWAGHSPRIKQQFSGTVAGEEWKTSARGVFHTHTHIFYFVLLFCFTLFLLASFYIKNPKKLESLVVVLLVYF
jgi:hypothetical protein